MEFVVELNNEDTKIKKKFQVFKNVSFDPRAIAAITYFVMTRNTRLYLPF